MNFTNLGWLCAICMTMILMPFTVYAEDHAQEWWENLYIKASGGVSILGDKDIDQDNVAGSGVSGEGTYGTGFASGIALGYDVTENIAAELSWMYQTNTADKYEFDDGTTFDDGDFSSNIFFINGYYFFSLQSMKELRPFVGAGLGWVQEIDIDLEDGSEESFTEEGEFAYQLMAGAEYALTQSWFVGGELRYTRVDDIDFESEEDSDRKLRNVDYDPLSVLVNLTYRF